MKKHPFIIHTLVSIITIILVHTLFYTELSAAQDPSARRLQELKSDSLNLSRILWRLKSPMVKKSLFRLLEEIETENRILKPYAVDFYNSGSSKHKYDKINSYRLSVDALLDSLNSVIVKARILRVNKIDFTKLASAKTYAKGFENSYVNLTEYPDFQNIDSLRHLLLETVLKSDRKSTIEWIWGRSEENDAFYSTKLTAFNGGFSVYPSYRTFIGANKLRDKSSWFFSLESYNPLLQREQISFAVQKELDQGQEPEKIIASQKQSSQVQQHTPVHPPKSSTGSEKSLPYDKSLDSLRYDVIYYNKLKGSDRHNLDYEKNMTLKAIIDSLSVHVTKASILKLDRVDIEFSNSTALKNSSEEYIDLESSTSATIRPKLALIISEALNDPDKRRSIEWILGRSKSGYSYYAVVVTAFDGQLTIFNEYKKIAGRLYIKDKNSWFNKLKIYKPE